MTRRSLLALPAAQLQWTQLLLPQARQHWQGALWVLHRRLQQQQRALRPWLTARHRQLRLARAQRQWERH